MFFSVANTNAGIAPMVNTILACGSTGSSTTSNIGPSSATISWTSVTGALSYSIQYRRSGVVTWTTIATTSSSASKNISGLSSSSLYEYQIQATCSSGVGSYSNSFYFTTLDPCLSPSNQVATSVTATSENLSWINITGILYYNFRYRIVGYTTWINDSTTTNSKTISGLAAVTNYEFQVQTRCTAGILSPFGTKYNFTTGSIASCGISTGLSATSITTSGATLGWTAVSGALSYNLQYRVIGAAAWTSATSATNSKALTGLIAGTTYEFQVQTVCTGATSSFSTSGTFTTSATPCSVPSSLTSTSITTTGATLGWAAVSGALSYNLQYRVIGATVWTSTTATTNSKAVTGLTASTAYEFQVQTVCTGATSSFSASGTFTTLGVSCGVPNIAMFGTINITSASATVYWTAITGGLSYNVQYRINGTTTWSTVSVTAATANLSGLTASTQYEFQVQTVCSGGNSAFSSSGIFSTTAFSCGVPVATSFTATGISSSSATINWSVINGATGYKVQFRVYGSGSAFSFLSVTTNSATLTGLSSSTIYEFQVLTQCTGGTSAYSTSGTFTTTASACGITNIAMFTATNVTASSATVGWAAVAGATSYNVQYRVRATAGAWSTINSSTLTANLSGLLSATQYEFQVQTICSTGTSAFSASGIFTTSTVTSCGLATGMNVANITSSSCTLNWTAVSGASSYNIQYRATGTATWTTTTTSVNSKAIISLTASKLYEFQVQTVCSATTSAFTASANFTTSTSGATSLPIPDHVVVVVFENHAYQQIIGNTAAPRINAFATEANTTLFTQSYGIEHPSQPNYLDLFAGSNQGVTNNLLPAAHFTTMNLARALINGGRTFKYYSEDLPSIGWDGETNLGYARKHNALANWMGTGTNQVSSNLNLPMTSFPTDFTTLPTVSFVSPNLTNSMHDGTGNAAITTGDNWFYSKIYPYVVWARTHNSLLIFTFDEDDNVSANRVATIFSGQMVVAGQNATGINHYNILRTIEDLYGVAHSGNAATAVPIHGCWTNGYRIAGPTESTSDLNLTLFPNPTNDNFNVSYSLSENSTVSIRMMSIVGAVLREDKYPSQDAGEYNLNLSFENLHLSNGIYFVEMIVNGQRTVKKILKE